MTAQTAIASAILRCTGEVYSDTFSSSNQIAQEMVDLVNTVAAEIMRVHDWRDLTEINEIDANGGTEFPKPDDYDRMVMQGEVDDPHRWFWGYHPFASVSDWLRFKERGYYTQPPGGWIIIGGSFHFWPAVSGRAVYPYISNKYAIDNKGERKARLDASDDSFVLDEELLTLRLVWRWKASKGLEYGEDLANYNTLEGQLMGRDKGSYVVRTPRYMMRGNVQQSYTNGDYRGGFR